MESREILKVGRGILSAVLAAGMITLALISATAHAGYVFVLQQLRGPLNAAALEPSYVDGMALQIGWHEIEPRDGHYDWRRLDQRIDEVRQRGKRVTLHVLPLRPPEWLYAAGAEAFTFKIGFRDSPMYGRQVREYIPWDRVFLDRWQRLTAELGKRYNKNEAVLAVSVTAPAPEMILPGAVPGSPAFQELSRRYQKDVYLSAWKQMIDAYQTAFPDKPKLLVPGIVLLDEYFADDVLAYAQSRFGDKLWLFNTGLRADGIPQKTIGQGHIYDLLLESAKHIPLGLQTIWSSTDDPRNRMRGPLRNALEQGLTMGASYFEIYAVDVLNPRLQNDLIELKHHLVKTKPRQLSNR